MSRFFSSRVLWASLVCLGSPLLSGVDECGGEGYCEATVDPSDPYYDRFEGIAFENACNTDSDCVVGGCSGEVCAAEPVSTTCEGLPYLPEGSCGCLEGQCQWQICAVP